MKTLVFTIRQFYFPFFLLIGIGIYILQRLGIMLPVFFHNYVNDLFCMPIVFSICQSAVRTLKSDHTIKLPLGLLVMVTTLYAWYFEWYLPEHNARYTGDMVDVVLYALGLLFFYTMEYGSDEHTYEP